MSAKFFYYPLIFLFVYFAFLIEQLAPRFLPKASLLLFIYTAFSFPQIFVSALGFFCGFLQDQLSINKLGANALLLSVVGFLIPFFRHYILETEFPYFFIAALLFIIQGLINQSLAWPSLIFTLILAKPIKNWLSRHLIVKNYKG